MKEPTHVTEMIFDHLEGLLPESREDRIRDHLRRCRACTDAFQVAATLREDVLQANARHMRPERLIELADARATARRVVSSEEQAHLSTCELCRSQLAQLETLELPSELAPARARSNRVWSNRARSIGRAILDAGQAVVDRLLGGRLVALPVWGRGVTLATGALVALALVLQTTPQPTTDDLARLAPLETGWTRGDVTLPIDYREGLAAYASGDYARARRDLGLAAGQPGTPDDVLLFAGSAALLEGETREGIRILRDAASAAYEPGLSDEIRWQLANGLLIANARTEARALLSAIVADGWGRAEAAVTLLEDLDARERVRGQ